MSRPKLKKKQNAVIQVPMCSELKEQLLSYAKRNDNGIVAVSARHALQKFLDEEVNFKK